MQLNGNIFGAPGTEHRFGGGATATLLHPVALVVMVIAIVLIFVLPRKYVMVPVLFAIFLLPLGQQIISSGIHWTVFRLIVIVGLLRVGLASGGSTNRLFTRGFNRLDKFFCAYVMTESVCFVLLFPQLEALTNQFGVLVDFLGAYMLMRALVQDEADAHRLLKCLAILVAFLGICMAWEQFTQVNIFGKLGGGVPEISGLRDGKVRSQGVFQHPLTGGTFAATLLPLFFLLWRKEKARLLAVFGLLGCTVMTICSNSSTPLLTYVAGVAGICFWPLRKKMRWVRRGAVLVLLGLSFVMKAPVWFVIAHIDLTGGSSSYHRAALIDQFVQHFWDWWLIGTNDAGNWGYDLWDAQNQYVNAGQTGGLLGLILFIALIVHAFSRIGKARRLAEGRAEEWSAWLLGVAVFANVVGFFGINYYDQTKLGWFALLAIVSAVTTSVFKAESLNRQSTKLPQPEAVEDESEMVPSLAQMPTDAPHSWAHHECSTC